MSNRSDRTNTYLIYKVTNGKHTYIGMTTQTLSARLQQHKRDAKSNGCSLTAKLCQKKKPADLDSFHRALRKDESFSISKLKSVTGTYATAHREENAMKRKFA